MPLGAALIAFSWWASWSGSTPLAHHTFFPLWLGYILLLDGETERRSGTSLWARGRRQFAALFVASAPIWWVFEAFNARLDNWNYLLHRDYTWIEYRLEASLAFSTVVPAIFVTAELLRTLIGSERFGRGRRLRPGQRGWLLFSAFGFVMIALTIVWPDIFFPLVWIGVFFLLDPINRRLGARSIAAQVERGWWGTVWLLFAATLICGFFWEMWNSRALPKWEYDIAYAEWLRVFEMPILGYGGYLPFGLETYALAMLLNRLFHIWPSGYLRFDQPPADPT